MTDTTKVTLKADGTVRFWSVYEQIWLRLMVSRIPDRELAAMSLKDRARVLKHRMK